MEETTANQTDGPFGAPDIIYTRALRQLWDDELTDDSIHKYSRLLCDTAAPSRCEALDPLFTAYIFGVPELHGAMRDIHRDFRRRAIFECEFLFVPLITARHTSLLTVDYAQKEILHEDSAYGSHSSTDKHARRLLHFLREHWLWKKGTMVGFPEDWHCNVVPREEVPQQTDGVSCGVFACGFATLRAQGIATQQFHMSHVNRMRIHMANCILTHTCPTLWIAATCTSEVDTQSLCTRQGSPEDHLVQSEDITGLAVDALHHGLVVRDGQHGVSSTVDSHDNNPGSDGKHNEVHDKLYGVGMSVKFQTGESGSHRGMTNKSNRVGSRQRQMSPFRSSVTSARARGRQKLHSLTQLSLQRDDGAISLVRTTHEKRIQDAVETNEDHVDDGTGHGSSLIGVFPSDKEDSIIHREKRVGWNYTTEHDSKRRRIQAPEDEVFDAVDGHKELATSTSVDSSYVGMTDVMCSTAYSHSNQGTERKRGSGQVSLEAPPPAKRSRK